MNTLPVFCVILQHALQHVQVSVSDAVSTTSLKNAYTKVKMEEILMKVLPEAFCK